jgi:hypothetical protein
MKIFFLKMLFTAGLLYSCTSETPKNVNKLQPLNETEKSAYLEKGRKISSASFALLSSKLKEKLETEGAAKAVEYCNLAALSLTDSIATAENVIIKRTSLKWRNSANKPDAREAAVLKQYQQDKEAGEEIGPIVLRLDNGDIAYQAPILMLPLCSKCHGKEIDIELSEKIRELYPNDMAIGFADGALRGMWTLVFKQ